jgi:hypothetical protein
MELTKKEERSLYRHLNQVNPDLNVMRPPRPRPKGIGLGMPSTVRTMPKMFKATRGRNRKPGVKRKPNPQNRALCAAHTPAHQWVDYQALRRQQDGERQLRKFRKLSAAYHAQQGRGAASEKLHKLYVSQRASLVARFPQWSGRIQSIIEQHKVTFKA